MPRCRFISIQFSKPKWTDENALQNAHTGATNNIRK